MIINEVSGSYVFLVIGGVIAFITSFAFLVLYPVVRSMVSYSHDYKSVYFFALAVAVIGSSIGGAITLHITTNITDTNKDKISVVAQEQAQRLHPDWKNISVINKDDSSPKEGFFNNTPDKYCIYQIDQVSGSFGSLKKEFNVKIIACGEKVA